MNSKSHQRKEIEDLCISLGADPLLVQGAGGNISWKEDETLWIKASGTWLSDAIEKDIFIPTDLPQIKNAVNSGNFNASPLVTSNSTLRPSIETLLHALMPQRVVVHLHAIDILSYLVREDCEINFKNILPENLNYAMVKYCKPGANLAKNVFGKIKLDSEINIVFLMNHGLVIGGDSAFEVQEILDGLIKKLAPEITFKTLAESIDVNKNHDLIKYLERYGYAPVSSPKFHYLATNLDLSDLVESKWALFPDHVVFLGAKALIGNSEILKDFLEESKNIRPPFIFCKHVGTFQYKNVTRAQVDQLNCFYDVAIRQKDKSKIIGLSDKDIDELVDWDAEKYRLSITK